MKRAGSILADITASMEHLGGMPWSGVVFHDVRDPMEDDMKKPHHSEEDVVVVIEALAAAENCIKIGHGGAQKDNGCNKCEALLKIERARKAMSK